MYKERKRESDEPVSFNRDNMYSIPRLVTLTTFPMPKKYKTFNCVPNRIILKTPVNTTDIAVA